jgi:hypothetical protein
VDYGRAYGAMHDVPKRFPGYSLEAYVRSIAQLVEAHAPDRLLDYGSGKGYQYLARRYHDAWGGLLPHCYDIGVQQLSAKPEGQFGGVICTDVLEHIEEPDLAGLIDELVGYAAAGGFVFLGISCRPTRKRLPKSEGGGDVHRTIKPPSWWVGLIGKRLNRLARENITIRAEFEMGSPPFFPSEADRTSYDWEPRS